MAYTKKSLFQDFLLNSTAEQKIYKVLWESLKEMLDKYDNMQYLNRISNTSKILRYKYIGMYRFN